MGSKAPVLLLTYRKADCLSDILDAIAAYRPPRLYVSSNLHANDAEADQVRAIRNRVRALTLPCEIICLFRDEHLLINDSIQGSLDEVLAIEDRVIVLEDDTVPAPGFFQFCNQMLDAHAHSADVGSIVGCNLGAFNAPEAAYRVPFAFFYWGWATWRDRWQSLRGEPLPFGASSALTAKLQDSDSMLVPFIQRLDDRCTWDIRWAWQQACKNMEMIVSGSNLVRNGGFVESGSYIRYRQSRFAELPYGQPADTGLTVSRSARHAGQYESASAALLTEILAARDELDTYTRPVEL